MPTQPLGKQQKAEYWGRPSFAGTILDQRRLLGERLRGVRIARDLSQERAAEAIGIHPVQLARIEAGTANFNVSTLFAMGLAYNLPLKELFETGPAPVSLRRRVRARNNLPKVKIPL